MKAILCGICGEFAKLDGAVSLEQFNMADGDLTVLACETCLGRLRTVYDKSGSDMWKAIRTLRIVMIEGLDCPVEAAVTALQTIAGEQAVTDRRLRFVVLDGGLKKPTE